MKEINLMASDDDILHAVRQWVGLLVAERYREAYDGLYHMEPLRGNELAPEDIRDIIQEYHELGGPLGKVTSLKTATGELAPRHDVRRSSRAKEGFVWFDLPVNGEWSDLTATFNVLRHDNALVLRLENIHVM